MKSIASLIHLVGLLSVHGSEHGLRAGNRTGPGNGLLGISGCGECASADPCDPAHPELYGKLCVPETSTVQPATPCDDNNPWVGNRGWWCIPNTATVLVVSQDFDDQSNLMAMRAATPAGSPSGALILSWDSIIAGSVPCDPNNPSVAGKWCEPNTANVVDPCTACGSGLDGLVCRVEPGSWGVSKICMNGGASATLDVNRWYVSVDKYSFLMLPPRQLAGAAPPSSGDSTSFWLMIVEATLGGIALVAAAGLGIALFLDYVPEVLDSIASSVSSEVSESVESELSGAVQAIEKNIASVVSFHPDVEGINWQILVVDNSNGEVLGMPNGMQANIFQSQGVSQITLSNGFQVQW